ncbi:hypothetical protein Tco_0468600 [Tanacetum coccineum]
MSEAEPIPPTLSFTHVNPNDQEEVATMIRGQPGLDELEFDDLYNNLKVYEHELKGVSTSSSQNIAFLSTEVKGSTLKQSTADPDNISKGYTQATSSKVKTAPNYDSHSDEIICSFFSQQASMPTTHDDEDLLQIDEDAMEEIDIRWANPEEDLKWLRGIWKMIQKENKHGIGTIKTSLPILLESQLCGELKFNLLSVSDICDKNPMSVSLIRISYPYLAKFKFVYNDLVNYELLEK